MYILLPSVIIKNTHLKHSIKFIFNNTATCRAQLLEMNLSETVEEVLSKLFPGVLGRITEYACSAQQRPAQIDTC